MPTLELDEVTIHYQESGPDGAEAPETVVFAHGLLFDRRIFDHQVAALCDRYRCIAYDLRGHGETEVTPDGYDMDTQAGDAAALIEQLGAAPCHFVGLSMGGFVGLRLASRRPELIRSLALLDTSADPEPRENIPRYRLLNWITRLFGVRPVTGRVVPILFGETTIREQPELTDRWRREVARMDRRGIHRSVIGVIERDGVAEELSRIEVPTLVIVGEEDVATVPEKAERIRDGIAGAELVTIPRAGHMSSIENPEAVTGALERFFASVD